MELFVISQAWERFGIEWKGLELEGWLKLVLRD